MSGIRCFLLLLLVGCTSSSRTDARLEEAHARSGPLAIPHERSLFVRAGTRIEPGAYVRPPLGVDGRGGVIVLEGLRGVTLDLEGVSLRGTPAGTDPDRNAGFGIVLRDCEDVTLRGGKIGGYKGCVVASDCRNLVIDGVTFDGWYAGRLASTPAAEDQSDWLYPHANDEGEWLEKYGAAISLSNCTGTTIRSSRGRHGQNGILLYRCERSQIYDNDFSFLSGWGLGMYRSSANVVARNVFDYCVRGYSDGVYWRGQDSAGILMFERCSDNLFALNSATHGGDGLFLFAGRDTVEGRAFERGELDAGGSDRNIWYRNDFSFAVANAIEATFSSDNWAIENRLSGSHQHGVWGGYSSRMVVLANDVQDTLGGAVSIEHGQECAIVGNTFAGNDVGVELWWDEDKDLVGGPYGKARDTRSRDHLIEDNAFTDNAQDLVIKKTTGVRVGDNRYAMSSGEMYVDQVTLVGAPVEPSAPDRFEKPKGPRDWIVGSDGSRPSGHLSESSLDVVRREAPEFLLRAQGWRPPALPGKQDALAPGRTARQGLDTIVIGEWGPWDFRSGEPRPRQRVPGGVLAGARWQATWFAWTDAADPRGDVGRWRALQFAPIVREEVPNFTSPWAASAAIREQVGSERFGVVATTEVRVENDGPYRLSVVSDDGVRVKIDGTVVLENWTWHAPTRDVAELELARGTHALELEYFQIDGASALAIELEPRDPEQ